MAIATYFGVLSGSVLLVSAALPDPGRSDEWRAAAQVATSVQGDGVQSDGPLSIAPVSTTPPSVTDAKDRELIESQQVCIASRVWSAGTMSDTVYYRYHRDGDRLTVGYFVHWSTERPWGDNWLTYAVVPALAVDGVYSHGLFVLPGARDFAYGPGDVEGASITYDASHGDKLVPVQGRAEGGSHEPVELERHDIDAEGRTALVTDVWSHQLGGRGAASAFDKQDELHEPRCFSGARLRPLNDAVTQTFGLGTAEAPLRAKAAWRLAEPTAI